MENDNAFVVVVLGGDGIDGEGTIKICEAMKANTSLTRINLSLKLLLLFFIDHPEVNLKIGMSR